MTRRAAKLVLPVLVPLALALVACGPTPAPSVSPTAPEPSSESPTPTPTPSGPPPVDELELSADGLNSIEIAGATPTEGDATAMIEFDADHCVGGVAGYPEGDPAAARWVPIDDYIEGAGDDARPLFGVNATEGVVFRIDVFTDDIPTTEGIRLGDSRSSVESAYPSATVVSEWATDLFIVESADGRLVVEVATEGEMPGYWQADELDTVVYVRAEVDDNPPMSVAGSGNVAGTCL